MECRNFWQEVAIDKNGWMNTKKEHRGSNLQCLTSNWLSVNTSFPNLFPHMYATNGLLRYYHTSICDNGSKDDDNFSHISLNGFGKEQWTMWDSLTCFWTFHKVPLLLQAAAPANLLRTCRVDNITTLRTAKKEVWSEIYFQQEKLPCKFTLNVLLQI